MKAFASQSVAGGAYVATVLVGMYAPLVGRAQTCQKTARLRHPSAGACVVGRLTGWMGNGRLGVTVPLAFYFCNPA